MFKRQPFKVKLRGRSGIEYSEGRRKILVSSEFLAGDAGIVIYASSLKSWEFPFDDEILSEEDKEVIKSRITQSLTNHKIPHEWDCRPSGN